MSWEGYQQIMCKNGHLYSVDANTFASECKCPHCSEKSVWSNIVDTTNGSFDDSGTRIDGYVEPKEKTESVHCTCTSCGHVHISKPATYEIPKNKRNRRL